MPLVSFTYNRSYLFHGDNTGSNPVGDAKLLNKLAGYVKFWRATVIHSQSWYRREESNACCDGTFTDVTLAAGLDKPTSTQAGVWVDINNDGLLDLFVGNEGQPAQLFLNKGDGTFKDIAASAGVFRLMFTKGVAAGDYDNDGFPDLHVSNLNGENFLYHNNHDNTFTEVAQSAGLTGPARGFATWFFDYDNDGFPDIFATSHSLSIDETARTYLGLPHNADTLKLYRNLGNGRFRDVTQEVGLDKVYMPIGANFGDIDNDGFLDIFLGTGNPSYASLKPSVLLHNKGGKQFVDVTAPSGTGERTGRLGISLASIRGQRQADTSQNRGCTVPFCACQKHLETRENTIDHRVDSVALQEKLCLFVRTTISSIVWKLLKRFGVLDGI